MIFERSKKLKEQRKISKLRKDLLKSARMKDKQKILELYEYAKTLDFDVINDKDMDLYNKAVDKCNDVLGL